MSKLELFVLFAQAMRQCLGKLYEGMPDKMTTFVTLVADRLLPFVTNFNKHSTPVNVWNDIKGSHIFLSFDKDEAEILADEFEARLYVLSTQQQVAKSYFENMNDGAVNWIKGLRCHLQSVHPVQTLPCAVAKEVLIAFDESAKKPCAGSSRAGPISWSFQLQRFAFYGTVLLDLMLVHEYLCHVIPRNTELNHDVREVWLHSCILYGIRNVIPADERTAVKKVWLQFSQNYAEHFRGEDSYGARGSLEIDELTKRLSGSRLFWGLTFSILKAPQGEHQADLIYTILRALSSLSDNQLTNLSDWASLEELCRSINDVK